MGLSLGGILGIAAAPFTGGASLALTGMDLANQANAKEASKNRAFQADMSSTAHQREVQDLRAAGLNPVLSAGGSGASTPNGAMATFQDAITPAISTAMQMKRVDAEVANMAEQNKTIQSQTKLNEALKVKAGADAMLSVNSAKNAALTGDLLSNSLKKSDVDTAAGTSWMGRNLSHIDRLMDTLGRFNPFVSSATSMKNSSTYERAIGR